MKPRPLFVLPRDKRYRRHGEFTRLLRHPAVIPKVSNVRSIWEFCLPKCDEHKSEIAVPIPSRLADDIFCLERAVIVGVRRQGRADRLPDGSPHDREVATRWIVLAERNVVTLDSAGEIGDVRWL